MNYFYIPYVITYTYPMWLLIHTLCDYLYIPYVITLGQLKLYHHYPFCAHLMVTKWFLKENDTFEQFLGIILLVFINQRRHCVTTKFTSLWHEIWCLYLRVMVWCLLFILFCRSDMAWNLMFILSCRRVMVWCLLFILFCRSDMVWGLMFILSFRRVWHDVWCFYSRKVMVSVTMNTLWLMTAADNSSGIMRLALNIHTHVGNQVILSHINVVDLLLFLISVIFYQSISFHINVLEGGGGGILLLSYCCF